MNAAVYIGSFVSGSFFGASIASLIYARKFRRLNRAYRELHDELEMMAGMQRPTGYHITWDENGNRVVTPLHTKGMH